MIPTVPVARGCPRCGGWFTRRALHPEEPPALRFTCAFCGEDIRIEDGIPVSVSYHADAETRRLLAHHEHAVRNVESMLRRREVGT